MSENSYKDSLNLPFTKFPMRGNLAQQEPVRLKNWQDSDLYQEIQKSRKGKKSFILHDGPPYANGNLHVGHAINKILKDIIVKSKVLQDYYSPYVPGWDCHGLPIELKVEEKIGKANVDVSAKDFRAQCREYALGQIDNQRAAFIRLGVQGDFADPYMTMNFKTEAAAVRNLKAVIEHDHLVRGYKPVHWCTKCMSALAEAEVEYADNTSPSVYVKFLSQQNLDDVFNTSFGDKKVYAVIWTTTPWTLPSNRAIAANENIEYAAVENTATHEVYIVAHDLVATLVEKFAMQDYQILGNTVGKNLELKMFHHPFYNYDVPVVLGDHVTTDAGTGLVHTAPDHGLDDYFVSKKYNIDTVNLVNNEGKFISSVEFFAGMHVFSSNKAVIAKLTELGTLILQENITHSYPNCWRHKVPVIFRATSQWFISMDKNGLRQKALEEIEKVEWIPDWGKNRIRAMVENRPDWCISRQRTWGTPLALLLHKETQELHPDTLNILDKVAAAIEKTGIQAWWDLSVEDLIGKEEADQYEKAKDTLDVWFDSGSTYSSVAQNRADLKDHDIDLYLEGSDQHRGWFMSSLMLSVATNNKAPYKHVLTHGFAVDKHGKKMSKSVGNIITPQEVIDSYGADILRLWVASADYANEITVDKEIFKRTADNYRRIRNTIRFLLSNLNGFNPETDLIDSSKLIRLDRWAIDAAYKTQEEIIDAYNKFQFHVVVQKITWFCSIAMGSFYLDIIKDRQYTTGKDSLPRKSCQTALWHIVEALSRWIAPILSFTADETWENMPNRNSKFVFTNTFYDGLYQDTTNDFMDNDFWNSIITLRDNVNRTLEGLRNEKVIKANLEAEIDLFVSNSWFKKLQTLEDELKFIFITSKVALHVDDSLNGDNADDINHAVIKAHSTTNLKCARCWHHTAEVGTNSEHPDLCDRCITNVYGAGELRKFA